VFPERTGVISGDVVLARKALLKTEEARRGAVAVGTAMSGATDVAMVFMNGGEVGSAAFGAGNEGFGPLAIRDRVSEAEAASTLDEGGAVLKGADRGLAAKEIRGRTAHEFEPVAVRVIERKDYAGVDFASKVFLAAEPTRFGENATTCTYLIFHKFGAEDR
jgi:hypothetical protein